MGRLGPLTSQALGRSPYDDVVEGEGEADPHEPERQYDDKGRVVNPETKRTIKNVIRAHNEVMLVIGVAEPENAGKKNEDPLVKEHQAYEHDTGKTLLSLGRAVTVFGIWGVHGFRQRVMLYRPYSHVEFSRLIKFERTRHSYVSIMFAGLPSFLTMQGLRWVTHSVASFHERPLIRMGLSWCQFHLHLFVTMQRLGLVPPSQWLPNMKFFVPFSSSSPIPPPPPVQSLSVASIGGWVNQLALNLAPYAALFICGRIWHSLHCHMWPHVHKHLPRPLENERLVHLAALERQRNSDEAWETIPESPTLGAADLESRHTRNPDQDLPTLQALEGQVNGPEPGVPLEAIRRQSTFSSRGEQDYATDEEDSEMINPTLISFDVDTSEATEQPPGVWSAELRPSYGGDGRPMPREEPLYMVNPLTSLPSYLAADAFTNLATYILITPYEAFALRTVARAFARRRGLPVGDMFDIGTAGLVASLSWRGVGHVLGLEALRFLIGSEIWCLTAVASTYLHVSEEEWRGMRKEEEEEEEAAQQVGSREVP